MSVESAACVATETREEVAGAGLIDLASASIPIRLAWWFVSFVNWLSANIANHVFLYPKRVRLVLASIVFIGAVGLTGHAANALLLDGIDNPIQAATANWLTNAMVFANDIFFTLAGTVVLYNIIAHFMQHDSVKGLFQTLMRTSLALAIPYAIMQLAPRNAQTVMCWAEDISGRISDGAWGGGCGIGGNITPDSIFLTGASIGWGLVQAVYNLVLGSRNLFRFNLGNAGNDLGFDITQASVDMVFLLLAFLLCLVMIAVFTFIAVELIMATLQVYFALPLGAWALGFLAVPSTGIASGYVGALMRTLVRFAAILLMITFAQQIGQTWQAELQALEAGWPNIAEGNVVANINAMKTIVEIAFSAIGLLYLVVNLPKLAEAAMTGQPVLTGGNAVMGGIGLAAGAAGAGTGAGIMGTIGAGGGAVDGLVRTGTFSGAVAGGLVGGVRGAWSGGSAGSVRGSAAGRAINRAIKGMRGGSDV